MYVGCHFFDFFLYVCRLLLGLSQTRLPFAPGKGEAIQRPVTMRPWAAVVAALSLLPLVSSDLLRTDFSTLFPQYNEAYRYILNNDSLCGKIYRDFRTRNYQNEHDDGDNDAFKLPKADVDPLNAAFGLNTATHQLVDCILRNTPEIIKVRMASAQVLLGLTPSLLAVLGPTPWHTGVIAAVGKRRLAALLIAAGSPALSPSLSSGGHLKDSFLRPRHNQIHVPAWLGRDIRAGRGAREKLASAAGWAVFYCLAVASIGNMAEVAYRIGSRAIFTFVQGDGWLMFLWAFLGLSIHAIGAITVFLRVRHIPVPKSEVAASGQKKLRIKILPPTTATKLITWFTAVYTVIHVFFGTLLFSSILFVSVQDSVFIVLRLLASVLFCRLAAGFFTVLDRRDVEVVNRDAQTDSVASSAQEGSK
ncbi:hypothetical protein JDV02_001916 [Purpureocillium takamizusanense]|uniref:Transmembrane protein n=1 Tax=Purpureocillium takamizusanense TaxID=2060973 RepID=A0A9Q8V809_9HYPO|nr:uncharacterized protein JDV02_001916 [Purpureocillium takamizusanense]UNI15379.1 hypothetical protein JDV02_001916 [Purpureocillium takamizusanense]